MKSLLLLLTVNLILNIYSLNQVNASFKGSELNHGPAEFLADHRIFKTQFRFQDPKLRLYTSIIPRNYKIKIRPILNDTDVSNTETPWTAPGSVIILVDCKEDTNNITLHSGVEIIESHVKVNHLNGTQLNISMLSTDPEKYFFTIHFDADSNTLTKNHSYLISMDFVASINNMSSATGIYWSYYLDVDQTERYLVTTHFQFFGARLAFPCFDEPALKSTFDITIGRLAGNYTSVSNTPLKSTVSNENQIGWVWDTFEQTPIMSTYLVAWLISDYTSTKAPPGIFDKPVQTLAPKHIIDSGAADYSAEIVVRLLAFYESYFLTKYPIGKMDSAMVVNSASSAMENWGLNIYRPQNLIHSSDGSNSGSEINRRSVCSTMAHELAHALFGNLVTCKYWTDFYLNEGFATYVANLGMRNVTPEFESEKFRLALNMQYAMQFDVLEKSHPVQLPPTTATSDLGIGIMTPIIYQKASALIQMMEGFLSEKTMQRGLQKYLQIFSFQSVEQDDLFNILTERAQTERRLPYGVSLNEIMHGWTSQTSYPILRVTTTLNNLIVISQQKFSQKNKDQGQGASESKWYIPVAVATEENPNLGTDYGLPSFWLPPTAASTHWSHNKSKWIVFNSGATGYYRVLYDDHLLKLIQTQLIENHTLIHHQTRSQLFDDQFTLAFAGYTDIRAALNLTKYLGQELEFIVWFPVDRHLRNIYNLLDENDVILFQKYFEPILDQVFEVIKYEKYENESGNLVIFRALLLKWACELHHPSCINYSVEKMNEWRLNPDDNPIPIEYQPIVYCAAAWGISVSNNDESQEIRAFFVQMMKNNSMQILKAFLSCYHSSSTGLTATMMEKFNSPEGKEPEELEWIATSIAENPSLSDEVMTILENNVDQIITREGGPKLITAVISKLSTRYNSIDDLNRIKWFVQRNSEKLTPVKTSLENSIAYVESNIKWMNLNREKIHGWLLANSVNL